MKKTAIILLLVISKNAFSWSIFGPKNYDECILQNMKNVDSELAARLIYKSCLEKFKEKKVDDVQKNRWGLFFNNDKGGMYDDMSTITRYGERYSEIVTVDIMFDYNKFQPLEPLEQDGFYSMTAKKEIDCSKLTRRHLNLKYKSGHMGNGNTVYSQALIKDEDFIIGWDEFARYCMKSCETSPCPDPAKLNSGKVIH